MADYPVVKTVAVPNFTPIQAKHINNLEDKVGIDGDPSSASLDYRVAELEIDHDSATGAHREAIWRIGATPVVATGAEINQVISGAAAHPHISMANLAILTTGPASDGSALHNHGSPAWIKSVYTVPAPAYRQRIAVTGVEASDYALAHGVIYWWDDILKRLWIYAFNNYSGVDWAYAQDPGTPAVNSGGGFKYKIYGTDGLVDASNAIASFTGSALTNPPWIGVGTVGITSFSTPAGAPFAAGVDPVYAPGWTSDRFYWSSGAKMAGTAFEDPVLLNNCFYLGYMNGTSGDHCYFNFGAGATKENIIVEVECLYNANPNQHRNIRNVYLGRHLINSQFGDVGHRYKFRLDGVVYEC